MTVLPEEQFNTLHFNHASAKKDDVLDKSSQKIDNLMLPKIADQAHYPQKRSSLLCKTREQLPRLMENDSKTCLTPKDFPPNQKVTRFARHRRH